MDLIRWITPERPWHCRGRCTRWLVVFRSISAFCMHISVPSTHRIPRIYLLSLHLLFVIGIQHVSADQWFIEQCGDSHERHWESGLHERCPELYSCMWEQLRVFDHRKCHKCLLLPSGALSEYKDGMSTVSSWRLKIFLGTSIIVLLFTF